MRRICVPIVLAVFIITMAACPCRAKEMKDNAATKLAWGIVNILMAPVELVKAVTTAPDERGMAYDLPVGFGKGCYNMGKRLGAGVYETATFPVPAPKGYQPLLKEDRKMKDGGEKREEGREKKTEGTTQEPSKEMEKEVKEHEKEEATEAK